MNHWDEIGKRTNDYVDGVLAAAALAHQAELAGVRAELASARQETEAQRVITAEQAARILVLEARIRELETPTTPPAVPAEGLPFAIPANLGETVSVFAHYFGPFPISLDNKAPDQDYYKTGYNNPFTSNAEWKAFGGYFRDRPLGRPPYPAGVDWRLKDCETDIRNAKAAGIDAFLVNIMGPTGENIDRYKTLAIASENVTDGKIKVVPELDGTTGTVMGSAEAAADLVSWWSKRKSAYFLPDGRFVVASFKTEGPITGTNPQRTKAQQIQWWKDFYGFMKSKYNLTVAHWAVFLDIRLATEYNEIVTLGSGLWGYGADPNIITKAADYAATAHALGKKFIAPIHNQDTRPRNSLADEARGFGALNASFDKAIAQRADALQLVTWQDFSEAVFQVSAQNGYTNLDLALDRIIEFKTGSKPEILRDVIYLAHRDQFWNAPLSSGQTKRMAQWPRGNMSPATDEVEVLSYLTAPASITVNVGDSTLTYDAPAGRFSKRVPLKLGTVSVSWKRDGKEVGAMTSPVKVIAKPVNDDLGYYRFSSLRGVDKQYKP